MLGAGRVNFSINLVIKPKFFRLKQNPVNELGESHNSKLTLFFPMFLFDSPQNIRKLNISYPLIRF